MQYAKLSSNLDDFCIWKCQKFLQFRHISINLWMFEMILIGMIFGKFKKYWNFSENKILPTLFATIKMH